MRLTSSRRARRIYRCLFGILGTFALLLIILAAAGATTPSAASWVGIGWTVVNCIAGLWSMRSTPARKELEAAHAALTARCKQLTRSSNPYTAVDTSTKQSIYIQAARRFLIFTGYTVAVGELDDIDYDPDTMRNVEFLTATFYNLSPGAAGARKRTEVGTRTGDDDDVQIMDTPQSRRFGWKELAAIRKAPAGLLFATAQELRDVATLLDTARPTNPDDE